MKYFQGIISVPNMKGGDLIKSEGNKLVAETQIVQEYNRHKGRVDLTESLLVRHTI